MVAAHSCIYTFEIRHFHQSEYQQQARGHGVLGTTSCEADKLARGRFLVLVIDCLASFFVHTWMNGFNSTQLTQQPLRDTYIDLHHYDGATTQPANPSLPRPVHESSDIASSSAPPPHSPVSPFTMGLRWTSR